MRQENRGADQTHYCCHGLDHFKRPFRPCEQKRTPTLHSQKNSGSRTHNRPRPRILRNRCVKVGRAEESSSARKNTETIDSPLQNPPHFRRVPVAISSYERRGGGAVSTSKTGDFLADRLMTGGMVVGADGDFARRFGSESGAWRHCSGRLPCAS